jgi:hypothetical protein
MSVRIHVLNAMIRISKKDKKKGRDELDVWATAFRR